MKAGFRTVAFAALAVAFAGAGLPLGAIAAGAHETADRHFHYVNTPIPVRAAEGGEVASYTFALTHQPSSNVIVIPETLPASFSAEVAITPASVTFTPEDWAEPQTFNVTAVDDAEIEGDSFFSISNVIQSSDSAWDGRRENTPAELVDDDAGRLVVQESDGRTLVRERSGVADTIAVKLDRAPTAPVAVSASLAPVEHEISLSPSTLQFDVTNWDELQEFRVEALADEQVEGRHGETVHLNSSSEDPAWELSNGRGVPVDVVDEDAGGLIVAETEGYTQVTEGDELRATDRFTVRLTRAPSATTAVAVSHFDGQVAVSPSSLSFTSANWSTPQVVTVSSIDDAEEEGFHSTGIRLDTSSGDPAYAGLINVVWVGIGDSDTSARELVVLHDGLEVAEGGPGDELRVHLDREPTADVSVSVAAPNGEVTASPSSLVFTPGNWEVPQLVDLTAVDDGQPEGLTQASASLTVTSADDGWDGTEELLSIRIVDNDAGSLVLPQTFPYAYEGGENAAYSVALSRAPTADVTVTLAPSGDVEATPSSLTFTSEDWDEPRTVSVSAVNDAELEFFEIATVGHSSTSSDPAYSGLPLPRFEVGVVDDDLGSAVVHYRGGFQVSEATESSLPFGINLDRRPTSDVTVRLSEQSGFFSQPGEVTFSPSELTFTPDNWATEQTVTLSAVNDDRAEGLDGTCLGMVATSDDKRFEAVDFSSTGPCVNILDDDAGALVIEPASLQVHEAGPTSQSYTLRLDRQPTAPVSLNAAAAWAETSVSPGALTFDSTNWSSAQTVTVTALDDSRPEQWLGDSSDWDTIRHTSTSADAAWDEVELAGTVVEIEDDDFGSISISPARPSVSEEGASSTTVSVSLGGAPVHHVSAEVFVGDENIRVSPRFLEFPAGSSAARSLTVTAVDDEIAEGTRPTDATFEIFLRSRDPAYDSGSRVFTVDVVDNDVPAPGNGAIEGLVTDADGDPLGEARVFACLPTGFCYSDDSAADGTYSIVALSDGRYDVQAYPPAGREELRPAFASRSIVGENTVTANVQLSEITPPPAGTSVEGGSTGGDGVPMVRWNQGFTLRHEACAGAQATYRITNEAGDELATGDMTEAPADSGDYEALVEGIDEPGYKQVVITVDCPGVTPDPDPTEFNIYIDPSGFVRTVEGVPIVGATVTLYRSDAHAGPYTVVPNGSAIMSPANRVNPDATDATGHFGWDVIAGYYKVRAEKSGCVSPADSSKPFVDSRIMIIPPPVTDLDLRLNCGTTSTGGGGGGGGGGTPPPTTSPTTPPTTTPSDPPAEENSAAIQRGQAGTGTARIPTAAGDVVLRFTGLNSDGTVTVNPATPDDAVFLASSAFDITSSTDAFDTVKVCLPFDESELESSGLSLEDLQLLHFQSNGMEDITTERSSAAQSVCGTTSSLSPFALGVPEVQRLSGEDRIGTAIAVSKAEFPGGTATAAVLARADAFPDALAGAPLAAEKNGPLLLTRSDSLPDEVASELRRVLPDRATVYVLGGAGAITQAVASAVEQLGLNVVRFGGADRFETAGIIADEGLGNPGTLFMAIGTNFPDALAAGAAAADVGGAILLTTDGSLPPATAAYVATHPAAKRYAIGGPAIRADLGATPVSGDDRYTTAVAVAERFFADPRLVGVASGTDFPDALTAGAYLGSRSGPLLLTSPGELRPASASYVSRTDSLERALIFGGPAALSPNVEAPLRSALR